MTVYDLFLPKSKKTWDNYQELTNHGAQYNRAREGLIIRRVRLDSDIINLLNILKIRYIKENEREVSLDDKYKPYKD